MRFDIQIGRQKCMALLLYLYTQLAMKDFPICVISTLRVYTFNVLQVGLFCNNNDSFIDELGSP